MDIVYEADNHCAAAYADGKQIGICQYIAYPDKWVINHTYTEPEYGGQGIARKLVECIAEQAQLDGMALEATCWYARKVLNIDGSGKDQ